MEKKISIVIAFFLLTGITFANTIIVDKNGGGQFTSIQTAILNSSAGDTIKVWPGTYNEQITINKSIVLLGSGYENTIITGNFNPTITMSSGKILWFTVSSLAGIGININSGTISNCVINGCSSHGIHCNTGTTGLVLNCVIFNNGGHGILADNWAYLTATNCISRNNNGSGFYGYCGYGSSQVAVSYSNGSRTATSGNQGCIDVDPVFTSLTDFHISQGSPCWNTGNPSLQDPDGSISDMGYFGGPDCPIYPTVYEIIITPNGNNINLEAKGRANY
jgi:hypothetical protein